MSSMIKIQMNGNLQWAAAQTSSGWMAICEPIGIVAEGSSIDELMSVIPETLHLLFGDLLADEELEGFLTERGWTSIEQKSLNGSDEIGFQVPWELVARGCDDTTYHPH